MTVTAREVGERRGGLVLAGGRGRRFGRPKADVRVGGTTLVERAVAALRVCCDDVVVASRREVPLPALDARIVIDAGDEPSALGGMWTGLGVLDTAQVVVVACDLLVEPALIHRLLAAPGDHAVAVDDHGAQPLCARYRRVSALAACDRLIEEGDLRARRMIDLLAPATVTVRPGELRNVNTWPDAFAASLDVSSLSDEAIELILALTRDVARGTERVNGPVASFLAGVRAGRAGDDVETALRQAIAAAAELLP